MTSDAPLTAAEVRAIRSILKGLSAAEWRALKLLAQAIVAGGVSGGGAPASAGSNGASGSVSQGRRVATDAELDGGYGDKEIRKDPKRWAGASYVGARYSQCPSDYLCVLADFLDWKAAKEAEKPEPKKHANGTPYFEYDRKDAALCRGWAARNRGKELPPPAAASGNGEAPVDDGPPPEDYQGSDANEEWVPS